MSAPRGLTAEEAAAWARVAETVVPLRPAPPRASGVVAPKPGSSGKAPEPPAPTRHSSPPSARIIPRQIVPRGRPAPTSPRLDSPGLDSHWDRRFRAGAIEPDLTLDLHGHSLNSAHGRLMDGIAQARAMGARVVLLIAGKVRPVEHADRADKRGAIRAKVLDWLAASSHASAISALRTAHVRHGGAGALYIVLKRGR